jgi:hypothetical protein
VAQLADLSIEIDAALEGRVRPASSMRRAAVQADAAMLPRLKRDDDYRPWAKPLGVFPSPFTGVTN